jgi:hypothetical protein
MTGILKIAQPERNQSEQPASEPHKPSPASSYMLSKNDHTPGDYRGSV